MIVLYSKDNDDNPSFPSQYTADRDLCDLPPSSCVGVVARFLTRERGYRQRGTSFRLLVANGWVAVHLGSTPTAAQHCSSIPESIRLTLVCQILRSGNLSTCVEPHCWLLDTGTIHTHIIPTYGNTVVLVYVDSSMDPLRIDSESK